MFAVAQDLKAQVSAKVDECIAKISAHHNIVMCPIKIVYDINSARLGGQADFGRRILRVNPVFLNAHTEHYLKTTVPHEVAHFGVNDVWMANPFSFKRPDGHGFEWEQMMYVVGAPADRCHNYTVPEGVVVGKPKTKYHYTCPKCNKDMFAGPRVHANIQQRGVKYFHRGCGQHDPILLVQQVGKVTYATAQTMVNDQSKQLAAPTVPKHIPAPHVGMNKMERCRAIYTACAGEVRATIISKFVSEVGMTQAHASTYYATIKKG